MASNSRHRQVGSRTACAAAAATPISASSRTISASAYGAPGGRRTAAMIAASTVVSTTAASAARSGTLPAGVSPRAHASHAGAKPDGAGDQQQRQLGIGER